MEGATSAAKVSTRVDPTHNGSGLFSSESVLSLEKLIFAGSPLPEVLTTIARLVESQAEGLFCTIWLPDGSGEYLYCAAAPSLPGLRTTWGAREFARKARLVARPCIAGSPYM